MNAPLKIKLPQLLSFQLVVTTDYAEVLLHLFNRQKELNRQRCRNQAEKQTKREEQKAVLRMLRRIETDHAAQLRQRTRALASFCIIKAVLKVNKALAFEQGDKAELAKLCEDINVKTLNERLQTLYELKLIEYQGEKIILASWEKVCEVFKVPVFFRQPFYFIKSNGKKIAYVMKQKRMQEKEGQCKQAAQSKLDKCSELQYELSRLSGKGKPTLSALAELQWSLFLNPNLIDAFGMDSFLVFKIVRGDTALSYRYWSVLFGYKSKGGFAYLKRKLISSGLIAVFKRVEMIDSKQLSTRQSRSNCLGTGIYDRATELVKFQRPDSVHYLSANA